ncbi:MAG TPA: hypothetical protein VF042_09440 [Gemmatimonadaceae bacterium]
MKRILIAAAIAMSAGCDSGVVGASATTGVYTLKTVNGESLPFTISGSGANKTEIVDDKFTLYEGNTYAEQGTMRVTVNGTPSTTAISETGSYGTLGTSMTFTNSAGTRQRVAVGTGDKITFVENGMTLIFRK